MSNKHKRAFKCSPGMRASIAVAGGLLSCIAQADYCKDAPVDGEAYIVVNSGSGKFLNVEGGSTSENANVNTIANNGRKSQRFYLHDQNNDGYWSINAAHTGMPIDVEDASIYSNANIIQAVADNGASQEWQFKQQTDGTYRVVNRHSGHSLTVADGSEGSNVYQNKDASASSQRWWLDPVTTACGPDNAITLSGQSGDGEVELTWTQPPELLNLQVYYDTDSKPRGRVRLAGLPVTATSYTAADLTNGTPYWFWVKYRTPDGTWHDTNAISATPTGEEPSTPETGESYVYCSAEREVCTFTGTRTIRYGANDKYTYKSATDSIDCSNSVFGDPIRGVVKACYYSSSIPFEDVTYADPEVAATPRFTDISVHDPSIYETEENGQKTYYVFGSFAASAKSTDLMNWASVSDGVDDNNPLFGYNITNELAEGFAWTGEQSLWAADVVQLNNGKFAYYYNQSILSEPRGYTGVAISDSIEGPYSNQGIILKSGMWNQESENDGEIYNPTIHPNAVDPHAFYDKTGKLWLLYGSYSGGIFILELDPATGKPLVGQGYGKHLMGGDHSHIEGAFILYNPDSKYYYLFTAFGGLAANGGYNIRVARSTSPDGPYYDGQGNSMEKVRGDRNSIAPYAMKLIGGFEFSGEYGYMSPGHQSALYNSDTGQSFLVFHTRFPNTGEYHSVRVHEMFINSDGWPVVAPQRYAALKGENKVDFNDMLGSYKFVNHEKDINTTPKQSSTIQLNSDGTVSGAVSGTWKLESGNSFQLSLENLGEFNGVASWQWNASRNQLVTTFTAISSGGVSVWGTK